MKKNGFSLVELLIYLAVSAIIMAAVYGAVVVAQRSSSAVAKKTLTQQDARFVLDMMATEIRNASYNRWHIGGIWRNQAGSSSASMSLAGIQQADQNNILVEMDLNEDRQIGVCTCPGGCCGPPNTCAGPCAGNNEEVLYSYDGVDTITRATITAIGTNSGNQPLLGGVGTGTLVRNAQANVALFQYFIRDNNPANRGPFLNPTAAQIPLIRLIRITIVADTELNDLNTGAPKRMIYSTDVVLKNQATAVYIR